MKYLYIIFAVIVIGLGCKAFWLEPSSIQVSEHQIEVPNWPAECSGLRIAILADLHVGSPFNGLDNLKKIVKRTQQAKPDLILLPGDFVIQGVLGGTFVPPEAAAEVISTLKADLGVYAVMGNHDWWLDPDRVYNALTSEGITVLEDTATKLVSNKCSFDLVGVSDYWEGPHDVTKALSTVADDAPSIVFTHNPDVFPEIPETVELTIAGHTHGGQVYIPGIGRPIVPSEYGERYAIGHITEGIKHMFVSSGVGTSIIPVRFLVPPEVTILVVN